MRKNVIALLLSIILATGGIGTTCVLAAETTAENAVPAPEETVPEQEETALSNEGITESETASEVEEEPIAAAAPAAEEDLTTEASPNGITEPAAEASPTTKAAPAESTEPAAEAAPATGADPITEETPTVIEEPAEAQSTESEPATVSEDYNVWYVGRTARINLGATILTGKVTKASWTSSDERIVRIIDQDTTGCTVLAVSTEYGTSATITCDYEYFVGDTSLERSWSCRAQVQPYDGIPFDAHILRSYPETRPMDLAKDREGEQVWFSSDLEDPALRYITYDPGIDYSGISLSSAEAATSDNNWPVYTAMNCHVSPQKVGITKVRFRIARKDVVDGKDVFHNTDVGFVDVYFNVYCSHEFDEGVTIKKATQTANEIRECTCKYCGAKELKEILPSPTHVELTNRAVGIKIGWDQVPGARYYKVYRDDTFLFATSRLYATDTGVRTKNGEKFTYKVVASTTKDALGDSYRQRTATGYRILPSGIRSLKNSGPGKMTVTYGQNSAATGYVIRFSRNREMSDAKVITVKDADTLSRTFSGLTKGATYYVQMRAYKLVDNIRYYSQYSTIRSLTITK